MDLAALNAIVYRLVCTDEDPMYCRNPGHGRSRRKLLESDAENRLRNYHLHNAQLTRPQFHPSIKTQASFHVRILTEQAATSFEQALPKSASIMVNFLADRTGRRGMGQTFRQMFARIDPARRAQVVFGMDQLHRKYLATTGGLSRLPYDAAEHLTDEETVKAYLALVREAADPGIMMQARVDAARARKRLLNESGLSIEEAPSDLIQRGVEPRGNEGLFHNYLPTSYQQRSPADAGTLAGRRVFGAQRGKRSLRSSE